MEPRDAATVMLVRDAPGLEVFMVRRNLRSVFVAGAYVFPGGAVDDEDREQPLVDLASGMDDSLADERIGSPAAIGFWIAAIRESFEEAGVLLARDATTDAVLEVDASVSDELAADRLALLAGDRSFGDIVRSRRLVLDCGALAPVAHYITPPRAPRRYDTWFFVAAAPPGHAYSHDDAETVESTWIRPIDALERARNEEIELIYPTFRSLQALAQFDTAAEVLAAVDAAWETTDEPESMEDAGHGWMLGFADGGDPVEAMRHSVRSGRDRRLRRPGPEEPSDSESDQWSRDRRLRRPGPEEPSDSESDQWSRSG